MNILVLSPTLLGDSQSDGGVISLRSFLCSLADRHQIFCVAFDGKARAEDVASGRRAMETWASQVYVVPLALSMKEKMRAKFKQLFLLETEAAFFESPAFRMACRYALESHAIDLVMVSFPQMAQYVGLFAGYRTVMDTQDVFSVSKFRRITVAKGLASRLGRAWSWLKWVRFEKRYYSKFNHILTVTEQDRFGLSLFSPNLKVTTLPRLIMAPKATHGDRLKAFQIGFIGAFTHEPNVLSVRYLLERIVPSLSVQFPDLKVLIAGKSPPQELIESAPKNVTFAGFVGSIDEFYSQVSVVVAPLVTGGGIKIKVLEALLSGLPVVTTRIGAEGIDLTHGVNAMIADEADEFVAAVIRVLKDSDLSTAIGSAGKALAMARCSPENHARVIDEVFQAIWEGH